MTAAQTCKPTPAGLKLLRRFADAERCGRLHPLVNGLREPVGSGMSLSPGDGAQLAAARKLSKDGFAQLVGGRRNADRYVIITDCGRAALNIPA